MRKLGIVIVASIAVSALSGCSGTGNVADSQRQSLQGKCYEAYAELSKTATDSKLGPDTALSLAISETAASGNSERVFFESGLDDGLLRSFVYVDENVLQNRVVNVSKTGNCHLLFVRSQDSEVKSGGRRGSHPVNYASFKLVPDGTDSYSGAVSEIGSTLKILLAREAEKFKKKPTSGKDDQFDVLR